MPKDGVFFYWCDITIVINENPHVTGFSNLFLFYEVTKAIGQESYRLIKD